MSRGRGVDDSTTGRGVRLLHWRRRADRGGVPALDPGVPLNLGPLGRLGPRDKGHCIVRGPSCFDHVGSPRTPTCTRIPACSSVSTTAPVPLPNPLINSPPVSFVIEATLSSVERHHVQDPEHVDCGGVNGTPRAFLAAESAIESIRSLFGVNSVIPFSPTETKLMQAKSSVNGRPWSGRDRDSRHPTADRRRLSVFCARNWHPRFWLWLVLYCGNHV